MGRPATALGESSQYSCGNANLGVDSSLELLEAQRSMAEQQPEPPWGAIWINDNLLDTCVRKDELELFVAQQRARTDYVEAIAKIPYMLLYIDHLGLESLTASPGLAETHGGTGLSLGGAPRRVASGVRNPKERAGPALSLPRGRLTPGKPPDLPRPPARSTERGFAARAAGGAAGPSPAGSPTPGASRDVAHSAQTRRPTSGQAT